MSDYRGFQQAGTQSGVAVDQGLRAYMLRVYNYMAAGLAVTGLAAFGAFQMAHDASGALTPFGEAIFTSPLRWVIAFGPIFVLMFMGFRASTMSASTARILFWIIAAAIGVSMSYLGIIFTGASIARTLLVTAATFGAMSLYGYSTKRDLSAWGSFLFMGLIGIVLASIANIFMASSAVHFAISAIGVLLFTAYTAYDTQSIKSSYYMQNDVAVGERTAVFGAISLYLDFINLFQFLMSFMGDRR